ncbi:MAG: hypothetical protein HZC40_09920 [Chloroflexi bacterium]|nr:hypothetical protein [Chloroflexota bacterium]
MDPVRVAPFSADEHRAFVLAKFDRDDALAAVETRAFEASQRGGVPVDALHCSLVYLSGLANVEPFRSELVRYGATLGAFDVRADKLLNVNVGSLWLTLEKDATLRAIHSDLAGIARHCGLSNRGLTLDDWVPHILLARFPAQVSAGLPLGTCINLTLRVTRVDLTRQTGAHEYETLEKILLDG